MRTIASVTEDLAALAASDKDRLRLGSKSAAAKKLLQEAGELRARLPTAILLHYDNRLGRGRVGAARMRNNTCGACHLALSRSQLSQLRQQGPSVLVCENCGAFLLPEELTQTLAPVG
ncbi:MAG: hypothetical protein IAE77_00275 [Prosthecobacter sp.]|jgi:predicted  nucleic acid-binding Zn-ribbon protein|uniref:C4-type zinc ribbon domain-containing protein n=1 Tax=Prosthecobacter sp. TaxID=1965333 RepID=UPI0019E17C78|nr:C4-type zinc ribbon domain-containing protein [Prosthecobacter sp.]MBE2281875.1 hypothetical protein [Prosthecobacter sp.]